MAYSKLRIRLNIRFSFRRTPFFIRIPILWDSGYYQISENFSLKISLRYSSYSQAKTWSQVIEWEDKRWIWGEVNWASSILTIFQWILSLGILIKKTAMYAQRHAHTHTHTHTHTQTGNIITTSSVTAYSFLYTVYTVYLYLIFLGRFSFKTINQF